MKHILFVCIHNAGRSLMAEALFNHHARERGLDSRFRAFSAGTVPAAEPNPHVVALMRELGLDLAGSRPRLLTPADAAHASLIVTMGCGVAEACPGGFLRVDEDWGLPDPHGRPPEEVRRIRDLVRARVLDLLDRLSAKDWWTGAGHSSSTDPPWPPTS